MITICSIDPGLDRLSVAEFRLPADPRRRWSFAGPQDKIRQFVQVHHATTAPSQELAERIEAIARATHRIILPLKPDLVIVELPAAAGTYRRLQGHAGAVGGRIQETMMVSHYATGAIIASARTIARERVVLERQRAKRGEKKEQRLETVRQLLVSIGRRAEVRNADDLDAIGVGLQADWPF